MSMNPWIAQQVAEARIRDLQRAAALDHRGREGDSRYEPRRHHGVVTRLAERLRRAAGRWTRARAAPVALRIDDPSAASVSQHAVTHAATVAGERRPQGSSFEAEISGTNAGVHPAPALSR